tara:strand:+ start:941 stop:1375 length:435 start_codon:yes stop_codon:yes gene_type:complete
MIYISHRGYINGVDEKLENNPSNILKLLEKNIHVEIDVRYHNKNFYLGHDDPKHKIDSNFLKHKNLWCHAKNFKTLDEIRNIDCHYFWHQEDDYTLTSKGFVWVYPGKPLIKNSIAVLPEKFKQDLSICSGICTDNINKYLKNI